MASIAAAAGAAGAKPKKEKGMATKRRKERIENGFCAKPAFTQRVNREADPK
jgi:hypothetical protein